MKKTIVISFIISFLLILSCKKKEFVNNNSKGSYSPTIIQPDVPPNFPQMVIPEDNPLTIEGVELGRFLFYEKRLSGDNTMSCASCHDPSLSFSDTNQFSIGIDGIQGVRQSMALVNLGWGKEFFWDGRAGSLEDQAFAPVKDVIELHETWTNAVAELQSDPTYRLMFRKAFGTEVIDSTLVVKALAQFERTLISGNSKYDKVARFELGFTPQEARGFTLYQDMQGADCVHCHPLVMSTDQSFRNNGLNSVHTDLGLGGVNGNSSDEGKFKVPTLRNIELTPPYMHDGRFKTLDEVIDFYSSGVQANSPNLSVEGMEHAANGGVQLTPSEKADLKAFLLTLTDTSFINNPAFQNPFE